MTTIAVTGAGGLIGRALLASLSGDAGPVERILAIDVRPPSVAPSVAPAAAPPAATGPDVEHHALDVRDPALTTIFDGVDVVVHLAFQFDPIDDLDEMRAINVDGTRAVLEAARSAGVSRVIYLSSVLAYDAAAAFDAAVAGEMLTESSLLHGPGGFAYASHKRAVETWLWPWHEADPRPALTVLRSAAVLGPGVQNFVTRALEQLVVPEVPDAPPLQFVHVDDVVGAVVHALRTPIDGAFNVAPDGGIDFASTVALIGRPTVPMAPDVLERLAAGAHRLGLFEVDEGIVDLFRYCWVMSNERLRATGWEPVRSNEEALLDTMIEHEGYVTLGRFRLRRTTLRGVGLATTAAVLAASVAALRRR